MRQPATQQLSDGELYAIIENGVRLTGMPAWGTGAPENEESWALVSVIRHLPEQTDAELEDMKKRNPRSVHEAEEEDDEDAFLSGPADAGTPPPHHHH